MVECECKRKRCTREFEIVLIDTWWNVNVVASELDTLEATVLIDTWWNVNEEIKSDVKIDDTVLIDTWWNVNF